MVGFIICISRDWYGVDDVDEVDGVDGVDDGGGDEDGGGDDEVGGMCLRYCPLPSMEY